MLEWITIYSSVRIHFHVGSLLIIIIVPFKCVINNIFGQKVEINLVKLQVITNEESKDFVDQIMEKVSHAYQTIP